MRFNRIFLSYKKEILNDNLFHLIKQKADNYRLKFHLDGAGDGNRTRVISLEG